MDILKPFDYHTQLLSKVLDLRAEKAQVISSNIANAETPGFAPSEFAFEQDLANAIHGSKKIDLSVSNAAHFLIGPSNFNSVNGKITTVKDKTGIGDENGVNVDKEMLALSENELLYETAAQLLKKRLGLIKYVISGGQ